MRGYGRFRVTDGDIEDITPLKARDIVVRCFYSSQRETFARALQKRGRVPTDPELLRNIEAAVRMAFREAGGDFNHPSTESLAAALAGLARKAEMMGTPADIIEHHKGEIAKVLLALKA